MVSPSPPLCLVSADLSQDGTSMPRLPAPSLPMKAGKPKPAVCAAAGSKGLCAMQFTVRPPPLELSCHHWSRRPMCLARSSPTVRAPGRGDTAGETALAYGPRGIHSVKLQPATHDLRPKPIDLGSIPDLTGGIVSPAIRHVG